MERSFNLRTWKKGEEEERKVSLRGGDKRKENLFNNQGQRMGLVTYLRLGFSSAEERRLLTSCSTMTGRSAGSDKRSSKEISTCV